MTCHDRVMKEFYRDLYEREKQKVDDMYVKLQSVHSDKTYFICTTVFFCLTTMAALYWKFK